MKNIYTILKKTIFYTLIIVTAYSCRENDDDIPPVRTPTDNPSSRTVLVYMIADNNLNSYAYDNIYEMLAGIPDAAGLTEQNNLLVYLDPRYADVSDAGAGTIPRLIHITLDKNGAKRKDVIKYYNEQNSSSPEVMSTVINEVCRRFPAEQYGLILWSHGLGWLPYNNEVLNFLGDNTIRTYSLDNSDDYVPMTKAFGQDGNDWMNNEDMVAGIPDNLFDFIIFDACFMGSVEVLYELRNKADYFIVSPAEILAEGFPYLNIMDLLLTPGNNYKEICDAYFDFYANHSKGGQYRSATISLIYSRELEGLASAVRNIILNSIEDPSDIKLSSLQRYDRYDNKVMFDLGDYMEKISSASDYSSFITALERTVLYRAYTTSFLDFTINQYSGLSVYVPYINYTTLNKYYYELPWYERVWK